MILQHNTTQNSTAELVIEDPPRMLVLKERCLRLPSGACFAHNYRYILIVFRYKSKYKKVGVLPYG